MSVSTICSNKIKEWIAWNTMISDIRVCWHVTKKNKTQRLYLHITKELLGTLNNDSTCKTSRLVLVTPLFERVMVV